MKKIFNFFFKYLKNSTFKNFLIVGGITLIIKCISFFKEAYIASEFGLSLLLDTFFVAILIPSFISSVFLGSFKNIFIPNYVDTLINDKEASYSFLSTSFIITLGVSLSFLLVAFIITDTYLEYFIPDKTENFYRLIRLQFYFIAPCIFLWGCSSIINALLTINDEFTFSSLSSIFIPVTIIISLYFFRDVFQECVLAIGTLIGSFFGFIFLLIIGYKKKLLILHKPNFKYSKINLLVKQLPAKLSSGLLAGINPFVDQYFSLKLTVGSLAALNYGLKVPVFMIGIVGIAIGNVMLPHFSKEVAKDYNKGFKKLNSILIKLLILSCSLTVILLIASKPIVALLFERNAFETNDTALVSQIQQLYLLQIPSYIIGIIMIKFLTSINKNNFMVLTSFLSLMLNITLNTILINRIGIFGIALSTSIISILNSILLFFYLNKLRREYV